MSVPVPARLSPTSGRIDGGHMDDFALYVSMRVTRFWETVDRRGPDECWPWTGKTDEGYGFVGFFGQRFRANELALTLWSGRRRPEGFHTCHSCHNRACCNPRHLRFDTAGANQADTVGADRHARGSRHYAARLTDVDVRDIRRRLAEGTRGSDLAREYGVQRQQISKIKLNLGWKHLNARQRGVDNGSAA